MDPVSSYGKIAYDAYLASSQGQSAISGARLPTFDQQRPEIQDHWEAAAAAVLNQHDITIGSTVKIAGSGTGYDGSFMVAGIVADPASIAPNVSLVAYLEPSHQPNPPAPAAATDGGPAAGDSA